MSHSTPLTNWLNKGCHKSTPVTTDVLNEQSNQLEFIPITKWLDKDEAVRVHSRNKLDKEVAVRVSN